MTRPIKFFSGPARLGAVAIVTTALAIPQAQARKTGAGHPGSPDNVDFINSTLIGDFVIGDNDGFVGTPPGTITGAVDFSAANFGQFMPNGVTVTGGATFGDASVQTFLNGLTTLSQTLSMEPGTPTSICDECFVNASAGTPLVGNPNEFVFTATIGNPDNMGFHEDFTINGTSNQSVVFNIPSTAGHQAFDDTIFLMGGITSDQVLFNFTAGDYTTLSGGDPLLIDTGGLTTTGTYLDPNGQVDIMNSVLDGRIFGGGSVDFLVSDSTIVAPPGDFDFPLPALPAPEPTSLALLGAGLVAFGIIRRRHRLLLARS